MKKQRLLSNLFILLSFTVSVASAQEKEKKKHQFFKERDFTQSYTVSANDRIKIYNQFGAVDIKTWNKNEVKVDVHIATSSTNKETNDKRFANIDIKHSKEGNTVFFQTELWSNNNNGNNESNTIEIDYVVHMPAHLALVLSNRFGKTTIPDLTGKVDIDQQFGELVAGSLTQSPEISVKFGKASIEALNNAELNIEFAKDPVVIKNASGKLEVKAKHSKSGITVYTDQLATLEVDADFSSVGVVVSKNASADFTIKTDFGSMTNNTSFAIKDENEGRNEKRYGPIFNHTYKGTVGNGKMKVEIDGRHSDIIISNEAPDFTKLKKKKGREVI